METEWSYEGAWMVQRDSRGYATRVMPTSDWLVGAALRTGLAVLKEVTREHMHRSMRRRLRASDWDAFLPLAEWSVDALLDSQLFEIRPL